MENVESFDAAAYNIAPSEALVMDPQQRLMLEAAPSPVLPAPLLTALAIPCTSPNSLSPPNAHR